MKTNDTPSLITLDYRAPVIRINTSRMELIKVPRRRCIFGPRCSGRYYMVALHRLNDLDIRY